MNIIQSIFNNRKYTNNFDLKNILDKMNLNNNFKIINVVGTNGKGSVSHYLTENLKKHYTVGTFTSPHIFEANERIKLNNTNISNSILEKYISKYLDSKIHFFAIMFLCAIEFFNDSDCDIIILEAGIGGAHDPSNILKGDIGVLTSLGYDHMELFGDTLEDVLKDKIGIINKDMNFYSGSELDQKNKIISQFALYKQAKHIIVKNKFSNYKLRNQALASKILKNEFNIEGTYNELFGRTTILNHNDVVAIIDVAHNQDGILATLEYLKSKNISFNDVVITMSRKKDYSKLNWIFREKNIFVWQLDDSFISAKNIDAIPIKNLEDFFKLQKKNTLYIGTFYSIGEIVKNDTNKQK